MGTTFTNIGNASAEDWAGITGHFAPFAAALPDRILDQLRQMEGDYGGFPVDRLTHCLQTATRAHRAGEDEEYVVCALLHDIGDALGPYNHADYAAVMLQPFVSEANHWMIEKHAIFQGFYFFHHLGLDRNLRDQFKDHPYYRRTVEFCALYDGPAFDPAGETLPLAFFEPMLRRVFAAPKRSLYQRADGELAY
ncbi:HD domain-containing protein [Massilia niastensis]|uniref:HD domain-containing protein n=1 Tax=Massilia niastensis TaxID=544911 RepID=UPI00035D0433|nr:HD domain-containing protein [Massilia niastensis]